jgi:hypothetical protein
MSTLIIVNLSVLCNTLRFFRGEFSCVVIGSLFDALDDAYFQRLLDENHEPVIA